MVARVQARLSQRHDDWLNQRSKDMNISKNTLIALAIENEMNRYEHQKVVGIANE